MDQNQRDQEELSKLIEAAENGNIELLYELLGRDSSILDKADRQFTDNPLHVAVSSNQLLFAAEIANLKPSLARRLNQHGWSPMHIAAEKGQVEIVKKLLKVVAKELCFITGREMMTPLHCAAKSEEPGSENVIIELLSASPKCITSLTTKSETALHTAVKSGRYENFEALVEWIKKQRVYNNLSWKDQEGNTILHLAVLRRQDKNLKMVELLLRTCNYFVKYAVKINEENKEGCTALDVLMKPQTETECNGTRANGSQTLVPIQEGKVQVVVTNKTQGEQNQTDILHGKMQKILKSAGAKRSKEIGCLPSQCKDSKTKNVLSCGVKWLLKVPNFFSFEVDKDTPSDIRNALLVIFVLIVAVTYQTGINPPGGLWQDDNKDINNGSISG
ncbi:ankyrin repeat-containing protein BDA1-like, partial [Telopea speciosissima]|uniref:ankyrin repeat-containing protein BDA1-like n=1 Tax=Telopea speciosissima TaxID=54955 RepID=UPI001CC54B40